VRPWSRHGLGLQAPPSLEPPLPPPTLRQLELALAAERSRRRDAETRLAAYTLRASENNTALARNNIRLQEQLSRLRAEADVLRHEAGCQRAAAAARQREAAREQAGLQRQLVQAEDDKQALQRALAGKQVWQQSVCSWPTALAWVCFSCRLCAGHVRHTSQHTCLLPSCCCVPAGDHLLPGGKAS
jgi:hypothetical protein